MIKKLLIFFLFSSIFVQASILDEKIRNFLGEEDYTKHEKLIHILFRDEYLYIKNDNTLELKKILMILKANGLLKIKYTKPQELIVVFKISNSPIKILKILNSSLRSLGYYYYFTKQALYHEDGSLDWMIKFQTESAIDPLILINELKHKEIYVDNIDRINSLYWEYEINTINAKISNFTKIDENEKIKLKKPLDDYLLKVKSVNVLKIVSKKYDRWFPYIVFYDKELTVLKTIEMDRIYKGIKTSIPKDTLYIKVGDMYNLTNIKRGLNILVQNTQGE